MEYKHDLGTKIRAKRDITILVVDEETKEEREVSIPAGAEGVIDSCGRSSVYGFKAMYDVSFPLADEETEITFFENDLEDKFEIMNTD